MQNLKDIEIVCVDDCSSDNSAAILRKYAERDLRIKVISHRINLGLSISRNSGLKVATSDYIMFCDSDDSYHPSMCLKLYNAITKNHCEMAACGTNITYEYSSGYIGSDNGYYSQRYNGLTTVTDDVILGMDVSVWNKIFKREIIREYHILFPDKLLFEDAYFFVCYTRFCKNVFFVNEKLYNYVRRENSIMGSMELQKNSNRAMDHLFVAERIYDFMVDNNIFENNKELFFKFFKDCLALSVHYSKQQHVQILNECFDFLEKNKLTDFRRDITKYFKSLSCPRKKLIHKIKKFFVHLLCSFVPIRSVRRYIRKKLL
jgi:glycosyltransferase involved in cell wall biosynthesis